MIRIDTFGKLPLPRLLCAAMLTFSGAAHTEDSLQPVPESAPAATDEKGAEGLQKAQQALTKAEQKAELARLRANLAALQADRVLASRVADPISDAQKALGDADSAVGSTTAAHFLFLADRRVQLAQALAQNAVIEDQYRQLVAQRDQSPNAHSTGITPVPVDTPQQEELIRNAAALRPRRDSGSLRFTVDDLLVMPGTVTLSRDVASGLVALSVYLRRNPQSQLLLIGHARGNSNDEAIMRAAQSRADGVRNYLMRLGVQVEQITLETRASTGEAECARCVDAILDPPWSRIAN